jgi:hypothetical protein
MFGSNVPKKSKSQMLEGLTDVVSSKMFGCSSILCHMENGSKILKYHDTIVFEQQEDGTITLDSGGFRTKTTKTRINDLLPAPWHIYAENGLWWVGNRDTLKRYVFSDKLRLKDNKCLNEDKRVVNHTKKLRKQIAKYCKAIRTMETLPIPELGDCLLCRVTTDGQVLGDIGRDQSHLLSHLEEQYIHGSLLVNALRANGHEVNQFVWNVRDLVARSVRTYFCKNLSLSY